MTYSKEQLPKAVQRKALLISLSFTGLWILAAVLAEGLEEFSFVLEPSFAILSWLVIRQVLPRLGWYWVLLCALGWIYIYLHFQAFELQGLLFSLTLPGWEEAEFSTIPIQLILAAGVLRALEWLVIGTLQWRCMCNYISRAWAWIVASTLAGFVKGALEFWSHNYFDDVFPALLGAFGYGVVSGLAFFALFHPEILEEVKFEYLHRVQILIGRQNRSRKEILEVTDETFV